MTALLVFDDVAFMCLAGVVVALFIIFRRSSDY